MLLERELKQYPNINEVHSIRLCMNQWRSMVPQIFTTVAESSKFSLKREMSNEGARKVN